MISIKDVYMAQERYADYRTDAEKRRTLRRILQATQPQAGSNIGSKMWRQMQKWPWMLRFGAAKAGTLQNSPQ